VISNENSATKTWERRPRRLLKNISVGFISVVVALLFLESIARVVETARKDYERESLAEIQRGLIYSTELGWERKPGYKGNAFDGRRDFDRAGYLAVDSYKITDSQKRKLVFIGDSNTFGYGVQTKESFVQVVQSHIPDVNAINLGVPGYSSYQGRLVFQKYVPLLNVDLVVVSFNYNDRRYVLDPSRPDSAEQFERLYRFGTNTAQQLAGPLEISYLYRGLRYAMRKARLVPALQKSNVRLDTLSPRVEELSYRRNLSWIAEEAKRRNIPVVFVLLKDNPLWTDHLRKGIESFRRSNYEMAIAYLNSVVAARNPFSDLARLYLAKVYTTKGDMEKALKVVIPRNTFRDFDGGYPIRLDSAYNDIMRQVAREHNAVIVDAGKALDEHPYEYIDACHFNADGHRRVGQLLAEQLRGLLLLNK
jgi:lysophospholipase L1-like esterase